MSSTPSDLLSSPNEDHTGKQQSPSRAPQLLRTLRGSFKEKLLPSKRPLSASLSAKVTETKSAGELDSLSTDSLANATDTRRASDVNLEDFKEIADLDLEALAYQATIRLSKTPPFLQNSVQIFVSAEEEADDYEEPGIFFAGENLTQEQAMAIVELNVGGIAYTTTLATMTKDKSSYLGQYFIAASEGKDPSLLGTFAETVVKSTDNRYFIDRDGSLFRFILDYLRTGKLYLPEQFAEYRRLREEVKFYKLSDCLKQLKLVSPDAMDQAKANGPSSADNDSGYITVGYRGTFAFGRDGQADVKFRKINRILICGKYNICRSVFGDTLNESRDPDRGGEDRYTARLYLKHSFLELAFDNLADNGFTLVSSCASGTSGGTDMLRSGTDGEVWGQPQNSDGITITSSCFIVDHTK